MQFKVPQNITMEDRIAGPLTAIQFGIVVIGGMASFIVFQSGILHPLDEICGLILGMFTAILAVGKFNDQPMYRFIRYIVMFLVKPRTRVWHKVGAEIALIKPTDHSAEEDHNHPIKHVSRKDIAQLATLLDTRGAAGSTPKADSTKPQ